MRTMFKLRQVIFLFYFLCAYFKFKFRIFDTRKHLLQHQLKQFEKFKKKVLSRSIFYKSFLNKSLDEFPIIEKQEYLKNFDAINTQQIKFDVAMNLAQAAEQNRTFAASIGDIDIGLSTGTSGRRGVFLVSTKERALWAGLILSKIIRGGLMQKQRIALILRSNNNLYESLGGKRIKFRYFDLMHPLDHIHKDLIKFNPTVLIGPPSCLELLARYELSRSQKPLIQPDQIISAAETLTKDVSDLISQAWHKPVEQIYQATEGSIAHTCLYGGFHLNEDILIIEKEYIDKKLGYFIPVITDFTRATQPIVRYRLTDILVEDQTPCKCGSVLQKIQRVEGRCDDVIYLSGCPIFPDFLTRLILNADAAIQDFRLTQIDNETLTLGLKINDDRQDKKNDHLICHAHKAAVNALLNYTKKIGVETPACLSVNYQLEVPGQKRRRVLRKG